MANAEFPAPGVLCAYEPPTSLWALVESNVPGSEAQEVKIMLGESLVEQSLELHQEVQLLLEIWRDYRQETDNHVVPHRLPEPPAVRERLKAEIQFFVNSIKEKTGHTEKSTHHILSKHNPDILDYVMEQNRPGTPGSSRPSTAHSSRDGSETPLILHKNSDRPHSRISTASIELQVENLNDQLSLQNFGEVVTHLRETLNEEVQFLLSDIDFLQKCLDSEADFRTQSIEGPFPSIAELREERTKLEKDFLCSTPSTIPNIMDKNETTPSVTVKPSFPVSGKYPSRVCGKPQPLKSQVLTLDSTFTGKLSSLNKKCVVDDRPSPKTMANVLKGKSQSKDMDVFSGNKCDTRELSRKSSACSPEAPDHVTVRTSKFSTLTHSGVQHIPSPPSSSKPASTSRPTSAQRFRKMVQQCRE